MTNSDRINDLHREHRATYTDRIALQGRGLDYTDAYARTATELRRIENELAQITSGHEHGFEYAEQLHRRWYRYLLDCAR